jgi:hypothetical protein
VNSTHIGAKSFREEAENRVPEHSTTRGGDDRWFNNLFVGRSGLGSYDGVEFPVWMDGNVFLNGARPSKYESDPFVGAKIQVAVIEKSDGIYLSLDQLEVLERVRPSSLVTSELLGKARIAQQKYTDANGDPSRMSTDYFGRRRDRESLGWSLRVVGFWAESVGKVAFRTIAQQRSV